MVRFPKHKHLTPIMDHKEPCGWLREAVGGGLLAWLKLHIFRKWDATLRMSTEYTQAFISSVSLQIQIVCRPKIASHPPFFNLFYIKTQFCYPQMQLFYIDPLKAQKCIMVCVHIFFVYRLLYFFVQFKNTILLFALPDWLSHCTVCHWGSDILWLCWWNCASFQPSQPALHLHSASPTQPGHWHRHSHWCQVSCNI